MTPRLKICWVSLIGFVLSGGLSIALSQFPFFDGSSWVNGFFVGSFFGMIGKRL